MSDLVHVLDAPTGTNEIVRLLDRLGVAPDATAREAMTALKNVGNGKRKQVVLAALRERRERPLVSTSKAQVTPDTGTAERHRGTVRDASVPDDGSWLTRVGTQLVEKDRDKRPSWYSDPVLFATTCVEWPEGEFLTDYQSTIMGAVPERRRVAVRGPHGLGKSTLCAIVILWFALSRDLAGEDWKILTTAGSWRQLTAYLWPEITMWARRLRWDVIGRDAFDPRSELMLTTLRLAFGAASAGASDDPSLLEGMHSSQALVVFDESKSIVAGTWESLEGALSGQGTSLALAVSTPGAPSGVFFDIHARKAGYEDWACFHVTLDEAVAAGRISAQWAEARRRQWGEGSAVFKNRVIGEFASSDEDSTIPLEWIEAAVDRWEQWKASGEDPGPVTIVGVDVARMGSDQTVMALRSADIIRELRRYSHAPTTETTGYVVGLLEANPGAKAIVDVIGVGGGVVDQLREQGYKRTVAFNASASSSRKDRSGELGFINQRAAAWWALREVLDPSFDPTLALPPDDELIGDLTAPRYSVTSTGKIQIESKDEIRKRIGRSTDAGDAVVQACFDSAAGIGNRYMDYMRGVIADRIANPPPPPNPMPPMGFAMGGNAPIAGRRCQPGQHRHFANGACALCNLCASGTHSFVDGRCSSCGEREAA